MLLVFFQMNTDKFNLITVFSSQFSFAYYLVLFSTISLCHLELKKQNYLSSSSQFQLPFYVINLGGVDEIAFYSTPFEYVLVCLVSLKYICPNSDDKSFFLKFNPHVANKHFFQNAASLSLYKLNLYHILSLTHSPQED